MSQVDLSGDVVDARNVLKPHTETLRGLLQMWHMFHSAKVIANEFHQGCDNLSYPLKIACTQSLVINYTKPWSGNNSPEIKSLRVNITKKRWSYPFLDVVVQTSEHKALRELRNCIVAHLDQSYEGGGITLKGTRLLNKPKNRPQDPGTVDDVFLPTIPVISGTRGLWWLSDKEHIGALCKHIENSENLVGKEIRDRAKSFRLKCLQHMHVIGQLPDLFSVVNTPLVDGHVKVTSQADDPKPLSSSTPKSLKIGDQNILDLRTVYEPRGEYPTNVNIEGKGYSLRIGDMSDNGRLEMDVSFPEYPAPKGT